MILSLCDYSGNMVRPWIEAGHQAVTVDLQAAPDEPGRLHVVADVQRYRLAGKPLIVFAFPPCTHLAVSGRQTLQGQGLAEAYRGLDAGQRLP